MPAKSNPLPALYVVLVSVAAIVKLFASVGVRVILLPATNLISCVPLEAPDFVSLNKASLLESTKDDVKTFCVLASVDAIVTVSLDALVVNVTFDPAANVSVAVFESATTVSCPLTAIVLTIF